MNMFKTMNAPEQDNLFAGPQTSSIITDQILVAPDVVAKRGTLMTRDEATKLCSPVTITTETVGDDEITTLSPVWCVLSDDVDTTDATAGTRAVGYTKGEFNRERILFSSGITWEDFEAPARSVGIYLKPVVQRVEA